MTRAPSVLHAVANNADHAGNSEAVTATIDYVNWNLNGLNGSEQTHPEEEFMCSVYTRTRYADGYYWGGWKSAATPYTNGYGATPTAMQAAANEIDPGFMHVICYVPEDVGGARAGGAASDREAIRRQPAGRGSVRRSRSIRAERGAGA